MPGATLQTPMWFINSFIQSWFVKISLRRRHALTVADVAFSHKIDYVTIFKEILNPEGHPNGISGSKVTAILLNGGFFPLVELHREGSAPAACAAGLFLHVLVISVFFLIAVLNKNMTKYTCILWISEEGSTVQMELYGPSKCMKLTCPNGRRSNGPSMLRQFGPSKWTVVQWNAYVTSIWTVQMNDCTMDCLCYVNLDLPNGPNGPSSIWTVSDRIFGLSNWTSPDRLFGNLVNVYFDHPIIRSRVVQMDNTCSYIWMRPNQRYREVKMDAVQMNAVQMDGSGMSEWT